MPTRLIFGRMIDSTPSLITRRTVLADMFNFFCCYLSQSTGFPNKCSFNERSENSTHRIGQVKICSWPWRNRWEKTSKIQWQKKTYSNFGNGGCRWIFEKRRNILHDLFTTQFANLKHMENQSEFDLFIYSPGSLETNIYFLIEFNFFENFLDETKSIKRQLRIYLSKNVHTKFSFHFEINVYTVSFNKEEVTSNNTKVECLLSLPRTPMEIHKLCLVFYRCGVYIA